MGGTLASTTLGTHSITSNTALTSQYLNTLPPPTSQTVTYCTYTPLTSIPFSEPPFTEMVSYYSPDTRDTLGDIQHSGQSHSECHYVIVSLNYSVIVSQNITMLCSRSFPGDLIQSGPCQHVQPRGKSLYLDKSPHNQRLQEAAGIKNWTDME